LGIRRVALAHHADDQIELFFLRLFRGSGPDGLAGMKPSSPSPADPRVRLIRPLLEVRRAELESYARLQGIQHREDSSNADLDILRNRVRRELLPLLEQRYQPGLASVVLRTMQLLEAETEVTAAETVKWFSSRSRRRFAGLPVAVQRRVLRQQLEQAGIPADFGWIETLRLHRGHPVSIAAGLRLRRLTSGGLVFERTSRPAFHPEQLRVSLAGKSGVFRFDGREIRWRRELCPAGRGRLPAQRPGREYFDADSVGTTMVVRCWRPGDRFQPLGMERTAKLQDLFVNAKVPRDDRRRRILAEARGGVLFWVEGLAPGEPFKIRAATRHRLRWEWTECAVKPV
jgi:tRNA(Ile)-lysidine synthase